MFNGWPLTERFADLRREMDRLFEEFGFTAATTPFVRPGVYPAVNVWDQGEHICVEAEIPGVCKDDLEIYAVGKELTLKGCRRPPAEGENLTFHRQERAAGEFTRIVTLPVEVETDQIDATLKQGVLTIRLPKAATARPRHITVKAT